MIKFKAVVKMDSINDGIFIFVLNQIKIYLSKIFYFIIHAMNAIVTQRFQDNEISQVTKRGTILRLLIQTRSAVSKHSYIKKHFLCDK